MSQRQRGGLTTTSHSSDESSRGRGAVPTGAAGRPVVVAVDGPSGSGKSTVSREVARRLDLAYLDTGAMYRAVCWWCLERGIDMRNEKAVAEAARALPIRMGTAPTDPRVEVDGEDVAVAIRTTRISSAVSAVATNLAVRDELRRRQRQIIEAACRPPGRGCVAEGRDITTVVAPDADVRVLLTADPDARLARRAVELHGRSDEEAIAATRDQVLRRDAHDSTVSTFHQAAEGVHTVDSSSMSLEETVAAVLELVAEVDARVEEQ